MANSAEIRWSSLINHSSGLSTLVSNVEQARVHFFGKDLAEDYTPWEQSQGYHLPEKTTVSSESMKFRAYLELRYYNHVLSRWINVSYRLIWPNGEWQDLKTGFYHRFFDPTRPDIYVRLPKSLRDKKAKVDRLSSSIGLSHLYIKATSGDGPTLLSRRILGAARVDIARISKPFYLEYKTNAVLNGPGRRNPVSVFNWMAVYSASWNTSVAPPVVTTDTQEQREVFYRSISSVRTPGFFQMDRTKLPVNPFSCVIRKTNSSPYCLRWQGLNPGYSTSGGVHVRSFIGGSFAPPSMPLVHSTIATNKSITRLVDRAEIEINNLAQDVVQFRQLTNLIDSNVGKITRSLKALRRHDLYGAAHALWGEKPQSYRSGVVQPKPGQTVRQRRKELADLEFKERGFLSPYKELSLSANNSQLAKNWLELQMGWKPLLMDIHGAVQALKNYFSEKEVIRKVSASGRDIFTTQTDLMWSQCSTVSLGGVPDFKIGEYRVLYESTCRQGVRYRVSDAKKAFLSQTGFTSPVNLVWEIIPYSFVFDYFLPIGPFIESFSNFEGMEFIDGYRVNFTREKLVAAIAFHGNKGNAPASWRIDINGSGTRERVSVNRVKLTAFPRHQAPTFKNPFSVVHTLNLLALLQNLKKLPR